MKTTLDLPDALLKKVKLRALRDRRELKDAIADLLERGLAAAAGTPPVHQNPVITIDKKTCLPVIKCQRTAPSAQEATPERIAEILLAQHVEWHRDADR